MAQLALALRLEAHARFGTFVAGEHAALLAHVEALAGGERGETVWLWGPRGCGKSHLLQAACAAADARGKRSMYLSLAAPDNPGPAMLQGLERIDLLAVDDVDRTAGNAEWERALFALFNALHSRERSLLIGARQAPTGLPFGLADLASRAAGCTVYRLGPLAENDRLIALQRHALHRGLELDEAAAKYLLTHVERDMATLLTWLARLDEAALAAQRRLTVPFIRDTLAGET